jgi:beta-galactosidase
MRWLVVFFPVAVAACSHSAASEGAAPGDDGGVSPEAGVSPDAGAPGDGGTWTPPPSNRGDTLLDDGWRFVRSDAPGADQAAFDDSAWSAVTLPHTWNAVDGQDGPQTPYYRGIGWYRRHLTIDPALAGRKLYLQLDGANIISKVWVNGAAVGSHAGGFAAFRLDITQVARVGADNIIAVQVDNSPGVDAAGNVLLPTGSVPPLSGDFTFFGGLYRPVHLLSTDLLAIDVMDFASPGVYLQTPHVSAASADLQVTVKLANGGGADQQAAVTATVRDATGAVAQTLSSQTPQLVPKGGGAQVTLAGMIPSPHLWNGRAAPYLYAVAVEVRNGAGVVTDAVVQPLGVRSFSLDPSAGFVLNGAPLGLHGVDMHQDAKDKGWALADADTDAKMAVVTEIGATALRLAHYQHSQHTYDLADRLGIVVWAETPVVNRIAASAEFAANAAQQLKELVRQNYNHPSIVFWSVGNETLLRAGPSPDALIGSLTALVKTEDPTRIPAYAANAGTESSSVDWHCTACGFNEYPGWYYGVPADFAGWADGIHAAHAQAAVGVTEYGAGCNTQSHALPIVVSAMDQTSGPHTEEYQAFFHETLWGAMRTRAFLWGTYVWNLFDFASDGRDEGGLPGLNDKGLVTYDRQTRKDAFYFYEASWSSEPFVYVTSRRFTALPRSSTDVKVYSSLGAVDLSLNGAPLGTQTSTDHVFVWKNVPWAAGANTVKATATSGSATVTDTVTWMK